MSIRVNLHGRRAACAVALALAAVLAAGCGSSGSGGGGTSASAKRYDTIEPGVLKVAVESYMPTRRCAAASSWASTATSSTPAPRSST